MSIVVCLITIIVIWAVIIIVTINRSDRNVRYFKNQYPTPKVKKLKK